MMERTKGLWEKEFEKNYVFHIIADEKGNEKPVAYYYTGLQGEFEEVEISFRKAIELFDSEWLNKLAFMLDKFSTKMGMKNYENVVETLKVSLEAYDSSYSEINHSKEMIEFLNDFHVQCLINKKDSIFNKMQLSLLNALIPTN
jgi:hypothetical protein